MASNTSIVTFKRARKKVSTGRWRKNLLKREGSTQADLALVKPNANELAQKQRSKQAKS